MHQDFQAENDTDAVAVAVVRAPTGAVAFEVRRYTEEFVTGGAVPQNRSALVNELKAISERFAAQTEGRQ